MKVFFRVIFITSVIAYLAVSFIRWDLLWVKVLPECSVKERALIILIWVCKITIDALISTGDFAKETLTKKQK